MSEKDLAGKKIPRKDGTERTYNEQGLEVLRKYTDGSFSVYEYHPNGKLKLDCYIGTNGTSLASEYDERGKLKSEYGKYPNGTEERREYYENGAIKFKYRKNPDGTERRLEYNRLGKEIRKR